MLPSAGPCPSILYENGAFCATCVSESGLISDKNVSPVMIAYNLATYNNYLPHTNHMKGTMIQSVILCYKLSKTFPMNIFIEYDTQDYRLLNY